MRCRGLTLSAAICCGLAAGQTPPDSTYRLALADHKGQLKWTAPGFTVAQSSAKDNGHEIGLRGRDASGHLTFLGFLFLVPEDAPLTSAKCRDGVIAQQKSGKPEMRIVSTSEVARKDGLPLAMVSYTAPARDGSIGHMVRGFLAIGELCGDLEFASDKPISADDANLKAAFSSYELDAAYTPKFADIVLYAQILYENQSYKPAAALLEKALTLLPPNGAPFPSAKIAQRVITDQAAMAYGISGDLSKARAILALALAEDPDYPLYYFNLACVDAGEKKLPEARRHLQQAFERKANLNPGEKMPDPTKDDSFTPYQTDKEFWSFLEKLQAGK